MFTELWIQVFKTEAKGWGVRTWDTILPGALICEYTGVLRRTTEVEGFLENNYIFDIDCLQTIKGLDGREVSNVFFVFLVRQNCCSGLFLCAWFLFGKWNQSNLDSFVFWTKALIFLALDNVVLLYWFLLPVYLQQKYQLLAASFISFVLFIEINKAAEILKLLNCFVPA